MDDNNVHNKTITEGVYHTLGQKVFWLFFLQNAYFAIVLLFITIILFILDLKDFTHTPFGNIQGLLLLITFLALVIFFIFFIIAYVTAWLTYSNYRFILDADSFKI